MIPRIALNLPARRHVALAPVWPTL